MKSKNCIFSPKKIREAWGSGKSITCKGKKYRVGKMSYGDYFLEPYKEKRGETEGFSDSTLWLEKKFKKINMVLIKKFMEHDKTM